MTPEAFQNAIRLDMAIGCSTNSVLHLLAIAAESGVEIDLEMFNQLSTTTPHLASLALLGIMWRIFTRRVEYKPYLMSWIKRFDKPGMY